MRILCALLFLATAACSQTTPKRPMTFTDLMAMKRVSDPQVSPSGKWVLFSVTDVSLAANTQANHLWVVPVTGGKDVQVTFDEGESNGRFSSDGKSISLNRKGQVYVMPWEEATGKPGTAVQVTHVHGGASDAIWSPDSQRLLFTVNVYPECSDKPWAEEDACDAAKQKAADASPVKAQLFTGLFYRNWNAYTNERRSHIAVADASDGGHLRDLTPASAIGTAETPPYSLGGARGPLGYAWAPDSHEIAYVTNLDKVPAASTNNDVFTLRLDEPNAKALKVSTSLGSDDGPQYSPDGRWLAFRSQERPGFQSDQFRLTLYDRRSKATHFLDLGMKNDAVSTRAGKQQLDRSIDEFLWSDNSQKIFFAAADQGQEVIYATNIAGDDLHRFGKTAGTWGSLAQAGHDDTLIGTLTRIDLPTEIAMADLKKMDDSATTPVLDSGTNTRTNGVVDVRRNKTVEPAHLLTHLNDAILSAFATTPLVPYYFIGAAGTQVQGFIITPPNFDSSRKYPVKLIIHGGPQGAWGDAWSYRWNPQLMAASGYIVVMINPRGSTGYGQKFNREVSGDWGGKAYTDLMKGLDAAEAQFPFIDTSRECALGGSYGGFMANWILTHNDRFKCIVSHDGMYDPRSAYGSTDLVWFTESEFRRPGDKLPGQPWRYEGLSMDDDPFRKWSPMLAIADAKTPTLVVHSQKDYRLDVSQSLELFTALQRLGVPSEMLYFPDEGHLILKPQNSELWNKTVSDWCDKWTHTNAYAQK